jgi:hypothetical protein
MKSVFRTSFEKSTPYQYLDVLETDLETPARLSEMEGLAWGETWVAPDVEVQEPQRQRPDFIDFLMRPVASSAAIRKLVLLNATTGTELLPINVDGEPWTFLNVIYLLDPLDHERTTWMSDARKTAVVPEFVADRLIGPSLFRLPFNRASMYCWEDDSSDEFGFKRHVEAADLTGRKFEEGWSEVRGGQYPSYMPMSPNRPFLQARKNRDPRD